MNLASTLTVTGLIALVYTVVNFLRYFTNLKTHGSAVLTQLLAWIGAVLVVWLASAANVTKGIVLLGSPLHTLNAASIIVAGLIIGSSASVGDKILSAVDSSSKSETPDLIPQTSPPR